MTYTSEICLAEMLQDLGLPVPPNTCLEIEIAVEVSGKYRPATRFDPPEYPEAEASTDETDLAEKALQFYRSQLALEGLARLNIDEVCEFLQSARRLMACEIDAACTWALEQNDEPDEPEREYDRAENY